LLPHALAVTDPGCELDPAGVDVDGRAGLL
jgi:hypothetical protein